MKKTLIASAVAAATLATTQVAFAEETAPKLSGNIQLAYTNVESDVKVPNLPTVSTSTNDFFDNGTTLRIEHDHAISSGLTGFAKLEYDVDADEKGATEFQLDEGYLGVKGDFGSIQLGSDDTVYEWVDVLDMYEAVGLEGDLAEMDEGDNAQYEGSFGDFTLGATYKLNSDNTDGPAIAGKYAMGDIEVIAAYSMGREEQGEERGDAYGLAAVFSMGDLTLSAQYEAKSEDKDKTGVVATKGNDTTTYGVMAQYAMGASSFALGYQMADADNIGLAAVAASEIDAEYSGLYLQALHNVSDNMYVYAEYLDESTDLKNSLIGTSTVDDTSFALGATYIF